MTKHKNLTVQKLTDPKYASNIAFMKSSAFGCFWPLEFITEHYETMLSNHDNRNVLYGVFHDGSLIGYANYDLNDTEATLKLLVTSEAIRKCGVGSFLLNTSIDSIKAEYPSIESIATTSRANDQVINFYTKNGFVKSNGAYRKLLI